MKDFIQVVADWLDQSSISVVYAYFTD